MAARLCSRAIALDSASGGAEALAILGSIAGQRGKIQEAQALLLRSIDLEPNGALALTEAALLYMNSLGEPLKAVPLMKRLQALDPQNWLYLSNLGVAYAQLKNYPEAIAMFTRAGQLNPSYPLSFSNTAYAWERMGKYDSAVAYYRMALEKAPTEAQIYESLASVMFATGRNAAADSILAVGARILPAEPQVLYAYARSKSLQGKRSEGRAILGDGLRILNLKITRNPSVADFYAQRALFQAQLGQAAASIASVREALAKDSTNEETLIKGARAYAVLGRKQEMIALFRSARAANPEYDDAYLATALDFENYRTDPDLLLAARTP
jgi:tetratricopeptide (TPR) repeat protein